MKRVVTLFAIMPFISCTSESTAPIESSLSPVPQSFNRIYKESPENPENPYDAAGKVYDVLFEAYFSTAKATPTVLIASADVEALATASPEFLILSGALEPRNTAYEVQNLVNSKPFSIATAISNSGLSAAAKTSLTNFIQELFALHSQTQDFPPVYDLITNYETVILGKSDFSLSDKEIILTVTSICRFAEHKGKRKPKKNTDPDWDLLILSIAGSVEGAGENMAESVVTSLTAGIIENSWP